jgi:anthranilate/para-aminobenzoate synthase component I
VPQSEWQETMSKSRAIFKAAQLVSEGLYGQTDAIKHR